MSSGAVKSIFNKVKKQNDDLKNKSDELVKEVILDKETVLANYKFDYEIEEEIIEYLKDVTFELHNETHNYYSKIGKLLSEAQEKLANNKSGVFRKWFESIGLNKTFVYDNIARYNYIVRLTDNIKTEKVESLPVSLSYEISKESCPEAIRERVIQGEIKTKAEFKKAIKKVQQEKEKEIQEVEIVEDYSEKIRNQIVVLKGKLDLIIKEDVATFEKLLKVQEILDSIK